MGTIVSVPVNIFAKNQTDFNIGVAQPVTPLLSIYQLVKIARADENIAKAKAGLPVAETARKVEKNFFDLLVAQRELTSAEAEAKKIQAKWLTASNSGTPIVKRQQPLDDSVRIGEVVLKCGDLRSIAEHRPVGALKRHILGNRPEQRSCTSSLASIPW
jgi:hypothetical protein